MAEDREDKAIPRARGKRTTTADFDRNRDGLYGGLPKARDRDAAGATPNAPHPPGDRKTKPARTRQ